MGVAWSAIACFFSLGAGLPPACVVPWMNMVVKIGLWGFAVAAAMAAAACFYWALDGRSPGDKAMVGGLGGVAGTVLRSAIPDILKNAGLLTGAPVDGQVAAMAVVAYSLAMVAAIALIP
jgi:hypothetical protein